MVNSFGQKHDPEKTSNQVKHLCGWTMLIFRANNSMSVLTKELKNKTKQKNPPHIPKLLFSNLKCFIISGYLFLETSRA